MKEESSVSSNEFNERMNHLISKIQDIMNMSISLSKSEELEDNVKID